MAWMVVRGGGAAGTLLLICGWAVCEHAAAGIGLGASVFRVGTAAAACCSALRAVGAVVVGATRVGNWGVTCSPLAVAWGLACVGTLGWADTGTLACPVRESLREAVAGMRCS